MVGRQGISPWGGPIKNFGESHKGGEENFSLGVFNTPGKVVQEFEFPYQKRWGCRGWVLKGRAFFSGGKTFLRRGGFGLLKGGESFQNGGNWGFGREVPHIGLWGGKTRGEIILGSPLGGILWERIYWGF